MSIQFRVGEVNYKVSFEHFEENKKRVSICWIQGEGPGEVVTNVHGRVSCYVKDRFEYKLGRKYSFLKALYLLLPGHSNKKKRKEFCEAYRAKKKEFQKAAVYRQLDGIVQDMITLNYAREENRQSIISLLYLHSSVSFRGKYKWVF